MLNLLTYLKQNPEARERSNKNRVIAKFVWDRYSDNPYFDDPEAYYIVKKDMLDVIADILNLERKWRDILLKNPELRGSDYDDKGRLEEEKMLSLGYEKNITP